MFCFYIISDTELTPIHDTFYGYSLANGSIGVYNKQQKVWGIKAKNKVTAIGGVLMEMVVYVKIFVVVCPKCFWNDPNPAVRQI